MAAALVMNLPWLKLVGGLLLLWIGVKLLVPEDDDESGITPASHLWGCAHDHRCRLRDEPR